MWNDAVYLLFCSMPESRNSELHKKIPSKLRELKTRPLDSKLLALKRSPMDIALTPEYLRQKWLELEHEKKMFYDEREASGMETKLFVGNVDPETTDEELTALFEKFGVIKQCWILRERDGTPKRSGFVKFYYHKQAEAAIEHLHQKHVDKNQPHPLVVRIAVPKVKSAPGGPNMSMITNPMMGGVPPHSNPSVRPNSYAMPNANYGYPTTMGTMPQSQSYMPNMMVNTGMVPGNVPMVSHMPVGTMGMSPAPMTKGPVGANVYVNNIRPGVTDQQLFAVFGKYGNIVSTRLFPQGNYGFISFDNPSSASSAILYLNGDTKSGLNIEGKPLEVSIKQRKTGRMYKG